MVHTTKARDSSSTSPSDVVEDRSSSDASLIAELTSADVQRRLHAQHNLINRARAAVPALIGALDDEDPHLRSAVAQVLAVIAEPSTAPALAARLSDEVAPVRWIAAEGLVALRGPGLMAALHTLVNVEAMSPQLKAAVRHILLKLRDDARLGEVVKPVIAAMHNLEVDEMILVEAHKALSKLKGWTER